MGDLALRAFAPCVVLGPDEARYREAFAKFFAGPLREVFGRAEAPLEPLHQWIDLNTLAALRRPGVDSEVLRARQDALRLIVRASVGVFFHAGVAQNALYYFLGARELGGEGLSFVCSISGVAPWEATLFEPRFLNLDDAPAAMAEIATRFDGLGDSRRAEYVSAFQRARVFDIRPAQAPTKLAEGEPGDYRLPNDPAGDKPVVVSLACGDVRNIKGYDIWVNSENDRMQMARVTERSISARIRFLGARWFGLEGDETDDAMALALARAMGTRRRVRIGDVLATETAPEVALRKDLGVRAVFHVAAVKPRPPGEVGFYSGGQIAACVQNVLKEALRFPPIAGRGPDAAPPRSAILIPMLGAGDGGAPVDVVAPQIVATVKAEIEKHGGNPRFPGRIGLLVYTDADKAAVKRSLDVYGFAPC